MEFFSTGKISLSITFFFMLALVIFVFFRLFKYMIQYIRLPRRQEETLRRFLPVTELVLWILFCTWSTQYLFTRGYLLFIVPMLVFIIIILYLAWFALRDIIAGVIYRTTGNPAINERITIGDITGKITGIQYSHLQLEDSSGRQINIPYSRITGSLLIRQSPSESLSSHNFTLAVPKRTDNADLFIIMKLITDHIMSLPWSSQKKEPQVMLINEDDKEYRFSLTMFSIDQSFFLKTEKSLEKEFGARVIRQ